jgi:hypothetical protein
MTCRGKGEKFLPAAMLFTLLLEFAEGAPAQSTAKSPADQHKFFGEWKLNQTQSKMTHSGEDDKSNEWRSHERASDRVKVSWGMQNVRLAKYSARCDNTREATGFGYIRCRQVALDTSKGSSSRRQTGYMCTIAVPSEWLSGKSKNASQPPRRLPVEPE